MVHTIRTFDYSSYEDLLNSGMFSSEINCAQYLIDMKILPTKRDCPACRTPMKIETCPKTKYREGCCWVCSCKQVVSLRTASALQNRNLTYREFIEILAHFSDSRTVSEAAARVNVSESTIKRLYDNLHERIAEDIETSAKIGGPGTIVEIDEAKFGKRKYSRGRMVEGTWVLGGIQRHTDACFLVTCPGNKRDADTLIPLIKNFGRLGTTIITDKWKSYVNLDAHGYVHLDVNHSRNFVDPETGAHTNTIEGTWTHAKHKALRRGGRRTEQSLNQDLTEFIWRKQKGVIRDDDRTRKMFSREIPLLINYRRYRE